MTTATANSTANELVPLADRLRYMRFLRFILVAVVSVVAGLHVGGIAPAAGQIWWATGAYVAAFAAGEVAWRVGRRRGLWLYSVLLVIDAVYLVYAMDITGGLSSQLRSLVVIHLIAVALLASYRTGLKLVFWYVLLFVLSYHLPHAVGTTTPGGNYAQLTYFVAVLSAVTFGTSALSAVNERELRRRRFDLEALATLANRLEQAAEPAMVAKTAVESVSENFRIDRIALVEVGDRPQILASIGIDVPANEPVPTSAVLAQSIQSRTTLLPSSLDPDADPWLDALFTGARNLVVTPLFAEGGCVGALVFEHGARRGSRIERRLLTIIERFASHTALAMRNAMLLEKVQLAASTDALTGIANRRTFEDALQREIARSGRNGEPVSLVMLDLDHFKVLNDTYGHQTGDDVLRDVARVLSERCRDMDIAARYGGEEFTVILPNCAAEEAMASATRLWQALGADANLTVPITVSAGVATFPDNARNGEDLIYAADKALYEAKNAGRDRVAGAQQSLPRTQLGIVAGWSS